MHKGGNPSPSHFKILKSWHFWLLLVLLLVTKIYLEYHKGPASASDLTTENILSAVNKERALRNLLTLKTDSRLSQAAQSKADDMMSRRYFSHQDPEGNYVWKKIEAAGYGPYLQLGENLAIEFYDTGSLLAAWMNSPTHRANIINEGFKDQGMGLAFGSSGQYHSAIANTFGSLVATKPKPPAAPAPQPAPLKLQPAPKKTSVPAPKKPALKKTAVPAPTPPPAPLSDTVTAPPQNTPLGQAAQDAGILLGKLRPREGQLAATEPASATQQSLYQEPASAEQPIKMPDPASPQPQKTATGPVFKQSGSGLNQRIILAFGVLLLLLMVADIKVAAEKNLAFLDKKINNLAVLIISLIVIAFVYWL